MNTPKPGDRIRLVAMPNDPHPVAPGTLGTVQDVLRVKAGGDEFTQIEVAWDDGRSRMWSWLVCWKGGDVGQSQGALAG
jgi:hypothetical protein